MSKSSPGCYFDIGKRARDVLYKDYAERPEMQFHYKYFDWNVDLSCELEQAVQGLRTVLECTVPDSGKVELQYLNKYMGITGSVGLLANSEEELVPAATVSGLIGTSIVSLGGCVALDISSKAIERLNAGLNLSSPYLAASLTMGRVSPSHKKRGDEDKFDTLRGSFFVDVNPLTRSAIAAEVNHSLSENVTSVTMGAQHALLPSTLIKARLDSYGKAGFLVQQDFWKKFYVTMAAEIDLGGSEEMIPKLGFSMALCP
ncbi:mitochondrial outer membrane protein porin of 34 kDa-like isoform X1 [Arachis stenosperma]|uniref:mitochondrial outer membrane protein porin of 34 kDa-like isoform X1 n=1 Tax=Arachis stenosperma TaxID=217475 RepID=UPI0025AC0961|nr:mitochondrial outer membrane protein porin of 34 kDa-like isoform X1 [Arachis stenosperma]